MANRAKDEFGPRLEISVDWLLEHISDELREAADAAPDRRPDLLDLQAQVDMLRGRVAPGPEVTVTFRLEDVQSVRPGWSRGRCAEWLAENYKYLRDGLSEHGNKIIGHLLPPEDNAG